MKVKPHTFRPGSAGIVAGRRMPKGTVVTLQPGTVPRNGLLIKPYVYRGTGVDMLTAWMDEQPADVPSRRQERLQALAALPGDVSARQAAEQLGVHVRTIVRYRRELDAMGGAS